MGKVVIGIHGLRNKPEQSLLQERWKAAILEGLNEQEYGTQSFSFELVYWANVLYKSPLHQDQDFKFDDRYDSYPYHPLKGKPPEYKDSWRDEVRQAVSSRLDNALDYLSNELGFTKASDEVLALLFEEMRLYYSYFQEDNSKIAMVPDRHGSKKPMLKVLRGLLKDCLLSHQNDEILLVAHSMGTIISYDVLRELEHEHPNFTIQHYATIGSPLGLYFVKSRILKEWGEWGDVRVPSNVKKRWKNYSDKKDKVAALDTHLSDDFSKNAQGIQVEDDMVLNSYRRPIDNEIDHHSEWGYLRTPEISRQFIEFLKS